MWKKEITFSIKWSNLIAHSLDWFVFRKYTNDALNRTVSGIYDRTYPEYAYPEILLRSLFDKSAQFTLVRKKINKGLRRSPPTKCGPLMKPNAAVCEVHRVKKKTQMWNFGWAWWSLADLEGPPPKGQNFIDFMHISCKFDKIVFPALPSPSVAHHGES